MQSRWRAVWLGLPPGPFSPTNADRLVSSTLPVDAPLGSNFLAPEIEASVDRRLASVGGGGLIKEDRLRRFLLSSQPMCFNLFDNFQTADRLQIRTRTLLAQVVIGAAPPTPETLMC